MSPWFYAESDYIGEYNLLHIHNIFNLAKQGYCNHFVTFRNLRFSKSILVTAVCLFACYFSKSSIFEKYIVHRGLLLFEIFYFRKVYWSPRSVCL